MSEIEIENLQRAMLALASRLCQERQPCGAEARMSGSRLRCGDCPLDAVDAVWDDFCVAPEDEP